MKVTCEQQELNKALQAVSRATSGKSALPVLNNVLLVAEENKLYLSTTNLEIGIKYWMDAKIEEEGKVTVPVKLLGQYISLLQADNVKLSLIDEQTIHIEAKGSDTQIKGIKSEEFPLLPDVNEEMKFSVSTVKLNEAIEQTVFASALDETRPVLAGIYFAVKNKELKIVATDSYRLAEKKIELKDETGEINVIIPSKTVMELGRIISKYDESMTIKISKNQVLFELSNISLVSRLIEGNFPPYEQIIPSGFETKVKIMKEELVQTVKRVSLFSQENASNIKVSIGQGKLTIKAESDQVGNEIAEIPAEVNGNEMEIAFNANYVLSGLEALKSEEVLLEVNTETNPGLLRAPEKADYIYVVMPLKI